MGKLTIVRHGQAAFMTEDYDRLSPLGEEQSLALGRYWARHGVKFTHAFTGPRKRHRETARHAIIAAEDEGHALPPLQEAPGFDEYKWEALFSHALSADCAAMPGIGTLRQAYLDAETFADKRRAIHFLMVAVTECWAAGELSESAAGSFADFRARVEANLREVITAAGKGGHAVVFTSGGPAAICTGYALDLAPRKTVDLLWTLRNAGTVELLYSAQQLSLSAFNAAPHLETAEQWTYR